MTDLYAKSLFWLVLAASVLSVAVTAGVFDRKEVKQ